MKTSDGSDQAEAETVPRCVAAVFEPVKALENLLMLFGGNSGPVVRYRDDRSAITAFAGNDDLSAGAPMLDRVIHEIGNGIEDQIAVAGHTHLMIADDGKAGAGRFGRGIVQLHHLAGDFRQIDGAK